jgi:dTDP-6-deoxy-L-talose 4-dehydrogenase (NAD+)
MHEVGYHVGMVSEDTPCNPTSLYGIAKDALRRSLTNYSAGKSTKLLWLRGYYITGNDFASHSVFAKILNAAREGKTTFPLNSGQNQYDFMDIQEFAAQIAAAISQDSITGIVECCSGTPVSLGTRLAQFVDENNLDMEFEYGVYPDRPYDSPIIYGNPAKINRVISDVRRRTLCHDSVSRISNG